MSKWSQPENTNKYSVPKYLWYDRNEIGWQRWINQRVNKLSYSESEISSILTQLNSSSNYSGLPSHEVWIDSKRSCIIYIFFWVTIELKIKNVVWGAAMKLRYHCSSIILVEKFRFNKLAYVSGSSSKRKIKKKFTYSFNILFIYLFWIRMWHLEWFDSIFNIVIYFIGISILPYY